MVALNFHYLLPPDSRSENNFKGIISARLRRDNESTLKIAEKKKDQHKTSTTWFTKPIIKDQHTKDKTQNQINKNTHTPYNNIRFIFDTCGETLVATSFSIK